MQMVSQATNHPSDGLLPSHSCLLWKTPFRMQTGGWASNRLQ
jgi:hypothetical protein